MAKVTIETDKFKSVYGLKDKEAKEVENFILKKWEMVIDMKLRKVKKSR